MRCQASRPKPPSRWSRKIICWSTRALSENISVTSWKNCMQSHRGLAKFAAWDGWWRVSPRITEPLLRSYLAIGAISLAGLSYLLWIIWHFWALAIGGLHVYDPVLVWFVRIGFLTGPLGLLTSILGKGSLRWPACGLSAVMIFLWLASGMAA